MIKSMTAYARAESGLYLLTGSVEIRSYNNRFLDLNLRIPQVCQPLEERIRALVTERISRGRVEFKLQVQDASENAIQYEIDENKAWAYMQALERLRDHLGMTTRITLNFLTQLSGIIKPAEIEKDLDLYWQLIETCTKEALDKLEEMKKTEGDFLANDFKTRLDAMLNEIVQMEEQSNTLITYYQEKLKERIAVLTKGVVEVDPSRIAQEAAFMAERSDVTEELIRLKSHISQFHQFIEAEEPAGRKLNFLIQEFNRELNTIGSKSATAQLAHVVVDLKSEVEKIREQIQNIE